VRGLSTLVGITPPLDRIELDDAHLGGGYGVRSPAADAASGLLGRTEAVLTDPIYTGKALAWLVSEARAGRLVGRRVVFWHAGGTPGLFEPLEEGR
jgi:1-aminocyclopropane-1-carboxylate deaminase/D-cysteine desulfhydrase-like pyridoxal-dependent ACC family enzyme